MSETDETPIRPPSRVWARTGFDLEGIVGALAAWLVGLLLGWLWGPLFWVGAVAAIIILLATRKQSRTAPDAANLVVAPCDGVVHSIAKAHPPTELRLGGGERTRVRISSAPTSTNPIHAPITGEVASVVMEEPNPAVITASHPDLPGLAVAHFTLESLGQSIGCTVATGGFGPRLEMMSEPGDPVRAGRVIGKRRLGGWCDIYLADDARLLVSAGQTLVGSETVLCRLNREAGSETGAENTVEEIAEILPVTEDVLDEVVAEEVKDAEKARDKAVKTETDAAEPKTEADTDPTDDSLFADNDEPDEAASRLIKKLKDEAEKD